MNDDLRLVLSGRAVFCVALPLPEAELAFWHSLDQDQLCSMGHALFGSETSDLPEGIIGDPVVWGTEPWFHTGGIDLSEEVHIELMYGEKGIDEKMYIGAAVALQRLFSRPPSQSFPRLEGRTYLLYSEYEKSGYEYELSSVDQFDARLLTLGVKQFPNMLANQAGGEHSLIESVYYDGEHISEGCVYLHDNGQAAWITTF